MNMKTHGFFSRNDRGSIFDLENMFLDSDKYVYFIEDCKTQLWVTKEHAFTNNPKEALSFTSYGKATTYCLENKLPEKLYFTFKISQHEFI